jgi:hypothetical protein
MSQAGTISGNGGGGGGSSINEIVTQNGTAVPIANIIVLNGFDTIANNDNGITTAGGIIGTGSQNEADVLLTNRTTATITTTDATPTILISFSLGATPGTYFVYGNVQSFNASTPASGAYSFSGGYRTDGITATELGADFHDDFEDPVLAPSDIIVGESGNNVVIEVEGIAGLTINWNAMLEYRRVF